MNTSKQYSDCYIAFLDLLGFKNKIKDSNCEDILQIFDEMKNPILKMYIGKEGKAVELSGPENINCKVMSDSICFWIDVSKPNALFTLMNCCALFQAKLAGLPFHILVRGAIVRGNIYAEKDITFGPGLTAAYLLEEHSAKFPRIILTKNTLDAGIDPASEIPVQRYYDITFIDSDEYMCLDYLRTLDGLDQEKFSKMKLWEHVNTVLRECVDDSVRAKYVYLKNYYTRVFGQT